MIDEWAEEFSLEDLINGLNLLFKRFLQTYDDVVLSVEWSRPNFTDSKPWRNIHEGAVSNSVRLSEEKTIELTSWLKNLPDF